MAPISNAVRERRMELFAEGLKECTKCVTALPIESFRPNSRGWMGLYSQCRVCQKDANSESQKRCRKRNPEKANARQRRWVAANPDVCHAIAKRYRDSHPVEERLRATRYPYRHRLRHGRLRAEQLGLQADEITTEQLLADWERRGIDSKLCVYTGELLQEGWHLDHVIPLRYTDSPGHTLGNLVPCNPGVNRSKGNKHFVEYLADREAAACA